jgi:hypothetical protein
MADCFPARAARRCSISQSRLWLLLINDATLSKFHTYCGLVLGWNDEVALFGLCGIIYSYLLSLLGGLVRNDASPDNQKCVAGLARNLNTDSELR